MKKRKSGLTVFEPGGGERLSCSREVLANMLHHLAATINSRISPKILQDHLFPRQSAWAWASFLAQQLKHDRKSAAPRARRQQAVVADGMHIFIGYVIR